MKKSLLALSLLTAMSAGAMAQPAPYGPIPPPQAELGPPPPPPGPAAGFALVPGHWQWNGARYVWIRRAWVPRLPGRPYAHWVDGHWAPGGFRGWHWVPGHWA